MASRSKKTVLSVRIDPVAKAALDAAANMHNQSTTKFVEQLVEAVVCQKVFPSAGVGVALGELIAALLDDDELIYKLRLHTLLPAALSAKERVMLKAVFDNPLIFAGTDQYLPVGMAQPEEGTSGGVSVARVRLFWPLLLEFADFISHNDMDLMLKDYMGLLRLTARLDEIYEVEPSLFG